MLVFSPKYQFAKTLILYYEIYKNVFSGLGSLHFLHIAP